jgi:IS605 OrfB family transposase
MNDDHLAAWHLDIHGNPVGAPQRFFYELSGSTQHRDAQIRHALTRLLHHTRRCAATAIALEDLDFTDGKSREKHGRNKRFRRLVSRFPTARLKARLVSMAAEQNIAIVAVDPAYTSRWGAQHWQQPLTTPTRKTTRHDAAAVAIGRRALGHPIRRRTAPPRNDQSDRCGHRTVQAGPQAPGREGPRPRIPGPRPGVVPPGRGAKTGDQRAQHRSEHAPEHEPWHQDSLPLNLWERYALPDGGGLGEGVDKGSRTGQLALRWKGWSRSDRCQWWCSRCSWSAVTPASASAVGASTGPAGGGTRDGRCAASRAEATRPGRMIRTT